MANSNGWGDGAANNAIGWGQGANNSISWGKSHSLSNAGLTDIVGLTTDADAQAFITAAAITDATQQSAIDTLVKGLKTDGIWTKMKAIYPFVGGTATTHKYNLKDPRDLDAAFRLVFNGGWTHSSNGALPNGTNGYADTKLLPSSVFSSNADNAGISVYQTNPPIGQNNGAFDPTTRFFGQLTSLAFDARLNTQDTVIYTIPYVSDGKGLVTITRNGTNNTRCYKNGTYISQIAVDTALTPFSSYVGARNGSGTASLYDNTIQKFLSYHNGLTDTQASNLYTRVQAFQNSLNRAVI
jgi:hypothetical protein